MKVNVFKCIYEYDYNEYMSVDVIKKNQNLKFTCIRENSFSLHYTGFTLTISRKNNF